MIKLFKFFISKVVEALTPFVDALGMLGTTIFIGLIFFFVVYRYNQKIFDWIESQTLGSRTYILEKFKLLFIEVKEDHVTYFLLCISVGLGSILFIVIGFLGHWLVGFAVGVVWSFIGFKIPKFVVDHMVAKRIEEYQNQMVDSLTLLANGLSAGLSLNQSLALVVDEMPNPISQEFREMLRENGVGVPINECFDNLAKRVPTADNDLFVTTVNILRESGGNMIEGFGTITGIIRERIRLQQKIDVFTASGKMQGYTIAAMPFAMGIMFTLSDPELMKPLFTTGLGAAALIFIILLDLVGLAVILKIVKMKI